jgi:hypothetical protein
MAMVRSITITTAVKEDGKEAGAVTGHTVRCVVERRCVWRSSVRPPRCRRLEGSVMVRTHRLPPYLDTPSLSRHALLGPRHPDELDGTPGPVAPSQEQS